jgi:hypothetical protein
MPRHSVRYDAVVLDDQDLRHRLDDPALETRRGFARGERLVYVL